MNTLKLLGFLVEGLMKITPSNGNILEDHILGQRIWEKLHALKGDLLTLQVGSKVITAVGMINSFRDAQSNEDLVERWTLLRDQISTFS